MAASIPTAKIDRISWVEWFRIDKSSSVSLVPPHRGWSALAAALRPGHPACHRPCIANSDYQTLWSENGCAEISDNGKFTYNFHPGPQDHFPIPFRVTTLLLVLGPMTPIAKATDGALPLIVGLKPIEMVAVPPGGSENGWPVTW